jgi:hypothetical protein
MIYLVSYTSLANSRRGRNVANAQGIPPYVEFSCRREPDFESDPPFISGLCGPQFVASLQTSDVLIYFTKKSATHTEGQRLVAVLELDQVFSSPQDAADWYQSKGRRVPYSCIVPGNPPVPIWMTDPKMTPRTAKYTDSMVWDRAVYVPRAKRCVKCFACRRVFLKLTEPPIIEEAFWRYWFDDDPRNGMRSTGLPIDQAIYEDLLEGTGVLRRMQTR